MLTCGADGEAELAATAPGDLFDFGQPARQGPDRLLGVGQECSSGVSQPHAAPVPNEQRLAEFLLERLQARRERRLGNAQGLSRTADIAPPGDLEEALDLR